MKLKSTQAFAAGLAVVLLLSSGISYADTGKNKPVDEGNSKKTAKVSASRNNEAVKIYPDILKRVMHVVAKDGNEGQGIDFFVFDVEGTLIQHYRMKDGDHQKLVDLKRGKYVFRVFAGDEEKATGHFDIR